MSLEPKQLLLLRGHDLRREVDWVLDALGRFLGDPAGPGGAGADPGRLAELARLNKVLLFLDAKPRPASLSRVVEAARLRTAAMNLAALALGREVTDLLAARGIRPVHLKGPLQQADLLGSPSLRPVGDVDLLVRARDRAASRRALAAAGFLADHGPLGTWWSLFLGEGHFRRAPGSVVDLHHRLDQPGLPPVRFLGALIDDAREQTWRGHAFLVPSRPDQALVAALGVVKAMIGEEPCGGHLVDLRAALDRLDGKSRCGLRARAARLGLDGVLALATQGLDAAFPHAAGRGWGDGARPLRDVADRDLRVLLIAPWALGAARPRRRALLWALSGGSPVAFARRAGWMRLSDAYREGLGRLPRRPEPK
jgi:hypothetical protein